MADLWFHPEAQAEYEDALTWYHARSRQAAERFEAEAERVLTLVASNPGLFPRYDDEHRFAMLRRFPYSVVYRVLADGLHVMAVAHSRRKPGYWHGRV